ncbi:toxin-antitoxin system YwqK family antitoxin [Burkholderia sp. 3C]
MNHSRLRSAGLFVSVALIVANLAGCGKSTLDYRNAELVNGKVYADGSNSSFSGALTNVPSGSILANQPGFQKMVSSIERVLPGLTSDYVRATGIDFFPTDSRIPVPVFCDAHVNDGALDGSVVCKTSNSDSVRLDMSFSGGQPDGKMTVYAVGTDKQPLATVAFKNGQPDGRQEIYSTSTHRLVHVSNWNAGVVQGQEEGFDENTGNRVLLASYVDGKVQGDFTRYAPDGKQLTYRATFVDGKPEGTEQSYDPQTGKLTGQAQYVGGLLNGLVKRWSSDGGLIYEKAYQNGQVLPAGPVINACIDKRVTAAEATNPDVNINAPLLDQWEAECREEQSSSQSTAASTSSQQSPSEDACVSAWTTVFRKENGEDALVTADQLNEWRSSCTAGKQAD